MKNKIIVALDVDTPIEAEKLFKSLSPFVGGFKVGPRLTFRCDKLFLKDISQSGILFFDHKFFDIPSTTAAAVEVASEMGAHWVTVHALNGPECLKQLSVTEKAIQSQKSDFRILVVTVLTSFSEQTLPIIWKLQSIQASTQQLAAQAQSCGLNSYVCSPEEIKILRNQNKEAFLVVPGIRPVGSSNADQSRVALPLEAVKLGASAIVVGRPIIQSSDPVKATKEILESLNE